MPFWECVRFLSINGLFVLANLFRNNDIRAEFFCWIGNSNCEDAVLMMDIAAIYLQTIATLGFICARNLTCCSELKAARSFRGLSRKDLSPERNLWHWQWHFYRYLCVDSTYSRRFAQSLIGLRANTNK